MPRLHHAVRGVLVMVVSALLATTGAAAADAATSSSSSSGTGTLRLSLTSPVGGPTVVTLSGPATFAHSTEAGGTTSKSFPAPVGSYAVTTPDVVVKGLTYRAAVAQRTVAVKRGRSTAVTVTYLPAPMATDLRATSLSGTGVALSWAAPPASTRGRTPVSYAVRRTAADAAQLTRPTQGTAVTVKGTTATDSGLTPGGRYRYSLFTQTQFGWNGPVELELGTTPPAGSTDAAYALSQNSVLLDGADVASAVPTAAGLSLRVVDPTRLPAVGSAVVLPATTSLPGGFLGEVVSISPDGLVELVVGGIGDAFDYYRLDVPDFDGEAVAASAPARATNVSRFARTVAVGASEDEPEAQPARSKDGCALKGGQVKLKASPKLNVVGHLKAVVDKWGLDGKAVAASVDGEIGVHGTFPLAVESRIAGVCQIKADPYVFTLAATPVPLGVTLEPTVKAELSGGLDVRNLGASVNKSYVFGARFTPGGMVSINGHSAGEGFEWLRGEAALGDNFTVNGGLRVIVGVAAGTPAAGFGAGLMGSIDPINAEFRAKSTTKGDRACFSASVYASGDFGLGATAWLGKGFGKVNLDKRITFPGTSFKAELGGGPFDFPDHCADNPTGFFTISTDRLPDGQVGVAYEKDLVVAGGVKPFTWRTVGGRLPAGLSLSQDGRISGTPTAAQLALVEVEVTDKTGTSLRRKLGMNVEVVPPAVRFDEQVLDGLEALVVKAGICSLADCDSTGPSTSWGDPHLTTVDGVHYDYQGVGEFVAARSGSGAAEVQVRQQPWGSSRLVSVNTAAAARVGEHRLAVYRTDGGVDVRLDGKAVQLVVQPRQLGPAGQVALDADGRVFVTWADGSALVVGAGVRQALDLQFLPGTAMAEGMTGLLSAGAEKAAPIRVTTGTSLFDYAAGESTVTFTDTAFPYGAVSVETLPVAQKQAAAALCSGVGVDDQALLDACVLDVAVTGEPRFAVSAAEAQSATSGEGTGGQATAFDVRDFGSTDAVRLSGSAQVRDGKLRLTDSVGQNGYGWATGAVSTGNSFSSTFSVDITPGPLAADGVTFLLHSDPRGDAQEGGPGSDLGYMAFHPSVAVELDTYYNGDRDPDANHVAIVLDGNSARPEAITSPEFSLTGRPLSVRVDYDAATHVLEVFVGHDGEAPTKPTVAATVDLGEHLGAEAHLGLVGSTGAAYEVADVSRWSFGAKKR